MLKRVDAEIDTVHVRGLATEQCADKQSRKPLRRGLPTPEVGGFELRSRGEQVGAPLEELSRLSRLNVRNSGASRPRLDLRRIGGLAADQHRDPVARGGGQRLERRYGRARAQCISTGALDVERGSEPDALPGGDEAKRLVLCCGDGAHGLELLRVRQRA